MKQRKKPGVAMKDFFQLMLFICGQNMRDRYAGSILGGLWIFIWPLTQIFIYIVIFGKLMGARLAHANQVYSYGIYVAAGLVCWTCFASILQRSARALVDKRHIISKVAVDLRVFPLAICLEELLPFAAGLILLFVVDIFSGWLPELRWLVPLMLAIYCQLVLACGLGMFFAACAVFVRDTLELVPIALQMAFWFTPIVYTPSILPDFLARWIWLNPMADITIVFQQCFVLGGAADYKTILYFTVFSHAALALGVYAMSRWQKDIRDVL